MDRILESELMEKEDHARAYANADFSEAHDRFVDLFGEKVGEIQGRVLDLGCGPCDVTTRFAKRNPDCMIFAVDGSKEMLKQGQHRLGEATDIKGRIILIHDRLETLNLPERSCDCIISNSLLHHLPKPQLLWNAVKLFATPNAWVFIMDLYRPESAQKAKEMAEAYAKNEPAILKEDFRNSLCAAFELTEVQKQLKEAGLEHFQSETVSDRHMIIYGRM